MTTASVSVGGVSAISLVVHVPSVGAWWADCTMSDDSPVSGRVTLAIGDSLSLSGTVVANRAGVFAQQRVLRVVGGGAGWATMLPPRAYHNDGGVSVVQVAQDAAQEAGESIGSTFSPENPTLAVDFVRMTGPAARTLEEIIGTASWWVAFDGTTNVGTRPTSSADASTYELLEYDPLNRVATLAMDDLTSVSIGMTLPANERMPDPQTILELRYEIGGNDGRVIATTGEADTRGRIVRALRSISRRSTDDRYFGIAEYRVISMSDDRVQLQAVSAGLPDIGPVSMRPGSAGDHSTFAGGEKVLVQFIDGNRARPVVTHFEGKDGGGFVPLTTLLDATTEIKLGAGATSFVALATKVANELASIATTLGTGSNSGGTVVFGTPYVPGSVAAAKVKAE